VSHDPYEHLADRFLCHYRSLRGALRHALVSAQLDRHLPTDPVSVVDVGGGAGHQALRLARAGHRVTLVDPSARMLDEARAALRSQAAAVRERVRLLPAAGQDAPGLLGGERFDVVCCHGVLPYVDDPAALVECLVRLGRPGALLSLLFKNADALAMRAALEQRWQDAMKSFEATEDVGGLGVATSAHRLADVEDWLLAAGSTVEAWYGVRIFSDHLNDAPIEQLDQVLPVEAAGAARDPYRALGRLLHVIARASSAER
jgi:S-adenosylmethionine-dependent methyltransferase